MSVFHFSLNLLVLWHPPYLYCLCWDWNIYIVYYYKIISTTIRQIRIRIDSLPSWYAFPFQKKALHFKIYLLVFIHITFHTRLDMVKPNSSLFTRVLGCPHHSNSPKKKPHQTPSFPFLSACRNFSQTSTLRNKSTPSLHSCKLIEFKYIKNNKLCNFSNYHEI